MNIDRDYNSISPSAKGLVLTKALTTIPFAKTAAGMVWGQEKLQDTFSTELSQERLAWVLHFENRYRTIDSLLLPLQTTNVLEIASGFSFRGLDLCTRENIVYIDTDLPDSMVVKQQVVQQIIAAQQVTTVGKLLMEPLNVLDTDAFNKVVALFPPGAVTIVNEGLLMYLDDAEKQQACKNIHAVLSQRGGSWITGDVYLKPGDDKPRRVVNETFEKFRELHQIDEKKFDSYEAAEAFFTQCGFTIAARETVAYEQLSALHNLPDVNIPESWVRKWFVGRQTWKLVCREA